MSNNLTVVSWTKSSPTTEGIYLLKLAAEWVIEKVNVGQGDWKRSQNPEWLYVNGGRVGSKPVQDVIGCWLGPIPQPPRDERAYELRQRKLVLSAVNTTDREASIYLLDDGPAYAASIAVSCNPASALAELNIVTVQFNTEVWHALIRAAACQVFDMVKPPERVPSASKNYTPEEAG